MEAPVLDEEKVNILLVDDRPENLLALQAVLNDLRQNLVLAGSGEEALKQVTERDFALILLDVAMPGLNGIETANLIRQKPRSKTLPIIFLTAFQRDDYQTVETYSVGGVDYIAKPFHPDILRAKVSVFVQLHQQRLELERQAELLRRSMLTIVEERKRTEAERLRRQELEQFAHIASHDLKEPLRALNTFSQLILKNHGDQFNGETKELLALVTEGATRINYLIDDLIEYAQVHSEKTQTLPVSLDEVFQDVMGHLQGTIEASGAHVTWQRLPELKVSSRQMALVFEHLLGNALKFRREQPPEIAIRVTAGPHRWLFEVQDNGIGFEPRYAERIFLLFKRLHLRNEYSGNGFGLALCKRIIERHGGQIWAESEPGRGSTFFFALPAEVSTVLSAECR